MAQALRYFGWEGYGDGAFASSFRRHTGLEIEHDYHLSDDVACRTALAHPRAWDIININSPFVRDVLHPAGAVPVLPQKYVDAVQGSDGALSRFETPARTFGGELIGIPQRGGPFNFVINQNRISVSDAREAGFGFALDRHFYRRFGVLSYEDFNVMHFALASGLNPFEPMSDATMVTFAEACRTIWNSARVVSADHNFLNRLLIDGDIDFYLSGGVYTASPARLAGHHEIKAITPSRGPASGRGGIAFVEINALNARSSTDVGETFLDFILSDVGAVEASMAAGACNPVFQMSRKGVFDCFKREQLHAMQWDDFEEDMSRCADYAIVPSYRELVDVLRRELNIENEKRFGRET